MDLNKGAGGLLTLVLTALSVPAWGSAQEPAATDPRLYAYAAPEAVSGTIRWAAVGICCHARTFWTCEDYRWLNQQTQRIRSAAGP